MKIKSIMTLALFSSLCQPLVAQSSPDATLDKDTASSIKPSYTNTPTASIFPTAADLQYGYANFKFNSTSGASSNTYKGVSKLYSAGADQAHFGGFTSGVYIFRVTTTLDSELVLTPNPPTGSSQSINNNTLFGHIMKSFSNNQFFLDFGAGLGKNQITNNSSLLQGTVSPGFGYASYTSNNWFASINAMYNKPWNNFFIKSNVGVLYSQISTGRYTFYTQTEFPPPYYLQSFDYVVDPLRTKATLVFEGVEIAYTLFPNVMPFINGSLIQVAEFTNNRPLVTTPINGSLPLLDMNQNGYRVGGGITFNRKQLKVRIEDKYYNANGIFESNQILVGLDYQFS